MNFVKVNGGIRIAYDDINPTARRAILFIHGWPLNRKIWEYQLNHFSQQGFRCITLDLPGFGDSDIVGPDKYTYNKLSENILNFIRALNLNNIILVGFSVGGAIAIRYMTLFGGFGVKKLVLVGAAAPSFVKRPGYPFGMTAEEVDELIYQAGADRPKMAEEFGRKLFYTDVSEPFMSWMRGISFSASGIGTIKIAQSLRDEDLRSDLPKIKAPTGIFHGRQDLVCPFDFAMEMYKAIRGSELYPFEDAGHGVFYDQLGEFNSKLYEFIDK